MRQLTFPGFTKKYVEALSLSGTTAIYPLVREATERNLRLREPLFLYALSNGSLKVLMCASQNTPLYEPYSAMTEKFNYKDLLSALELGSEELPEGYRKVWASYLSVSGKYERDARVKGLIRTKVIELQNKKGVTTYRLCKDLSLNNANINAWLKNDLANKVSIDTARAILDYLEK